MTIFKNPYLIWFLVTGLVFSGCAGGIIPPEALQWNQETLKDRQLQTRKFDTSDEEKIMSACAALLQDLGFILEESETKLGVMLGTKDRSAEDAGQIAGAVILALLLGVYVPTDDKQKFRASVVTSSLKESNEITVRVTFQRVVWNTQGRVTTSEALTDPKMYTEFFTKLSKSIFLEAHEI